MARSSIHATRRASLALLLAASLGGCGDGLLDARYRGEPLFAYSGQLASSGAEPVYVFALRAGVFWLPYDPTAQRVPGTESTVIEGFDRIEGIAPDAALVEQASIAVAVRFPGYFDLNVFAAPPADVHTTADGLSYGVLLVYEDRDGDARFDVGELVGGGPSQLVYYARGSLAADATPLARPVTPGYGLVELPLRCGVPLPEYPLDETYEVRVGAACTGEGDPACGPGGTCLLADLDGPLPGGYCVLDGGAIDVAGGVEPPETMALVETERDGVELEAWYRTCDATAGCREGYTCQQHICLPDGASPLLLDRTVEIEATCAEHHEVERREVGGA